MGKVAPIVGVWIEINLRNIVIKIINVAPFVGVWIEITFLLINIV